MTDILSPDMGAKVFYKLREFSDLPERGVLAGQAVSSAVFEMFHDDREGLSAYNDIDIFSAATLADIEEAESLNRTIDTVRYHSVNVSIDNYHMLNLTTQSGYKIVNSSKDGLLNRITYTDLYGLYNCAALDLIRGFDINCTQVAVDIETKKLYWTPEFDHFFRTKQLEISNVQTPNHTAMRWFKKRNDLPGAYGNDSNAMELISALSNVHRSKGEGFKEKDILRWRFGPKSAELYTNYEDRLNDYFKLKPKCDRTYLLEALQTPSNEILNLAKRHSSLIFARSYNQLTRPRRKSKQKLINIPLCFNVSGNYTLNLTAASLLSQGDSYMDGNISETDVRRISRENLSHRPFMNLLYTAPFLVQLRAFREWKKLENKYGKWIYGLVDVRSRQSYVSPYAPEWEEEIENYNMVFRYPNLPLVEHTPLNFVDSSIRCKELVTGGELRREGDELHHCVAGYADAVKSGKSRIFSLRGRLSADWSTLEVEKCGNGKYRIRQHFTFFNKPPSNTNIRVAESIIWKLNHTYLDGKRKKSRLNFLNTFSDRIKKAFTS